MPSRTPHTALRLSLRVAYYSILCAVIAAGAFAEVVYIDIPDAPATYDGVYLAIGSSSEMLFYRNSGSVVGEVIDWTFASPGLTGMVAFHPGSTLHALGLTHGQLIGPHLNYLGFDGLLVESRCKTDRVDPSCQSSGDWVGTERFLAVRATDTVGTHYGWVRLGHPGGKPDGGYTPVVVCDAAYENQPDTPLLAGSRNTLTADLHRALRIVSGAQAATSEDVLLLDRTGEAGKVDLADAVALSRISAGLN